MKIRSTTLALLVVGILFGGILLTTLMGWWVTETSRVPVTFDEGSAAGAYNPEDIRGSYSFGDISSLFDIPLDRLAAAFMLPEDIEPEYFLNKDLEEMFLGRVPEEQEIGNASVQLFTAFYNDLPYSLTEDVYLPPSAVEVLRTDVSLSDEQLIYLEAHTATLSDSSLPEDTGESTVTPPEEHDTDEAVVKGSTSFQDVLDWGVSQEVIEEIIGAPMPSPLILVKDYCLENGLSFGEIKALLQEEIDLALGL